MLRGGLAQLVEHLLCKQGVNGSSPLSSTEWIIDMLGTRKNNFLKKKSEAIRRLRIERRLKVMKAKGKRKSQ